MKTKDQLLLEQAYDDMTKYSKLSDEGLLETYKDLCDFRFRAGDKEEENKQELRKCYAEIKKRGSKLTNRADGYESYSREMNR